jgi:hypothetical protein
MKLAIVEQALRDARDWYDSAPIEELEAVESAIEYNFPVQGLMDAIEKIPKVVEESVTIAKCAITDIDGLLQDGFDSNVEDVVTGKAEISYDTSALTRTLCELATQVSQTEDGIAWMKETYPKLYKKSLR